MSLGLSTPTRLRIMKNAFVLYQKQGYDNVTITDICKVSGITKSTFYYHFASKDSILDDFNLYSETYVVENIAKFAGSSNFIEQLWNLYQMYADPILEAGVEIIKHNFMKNLNHDRNFFAPGESKLWDAEIVLVEKAQKEGQILNPAPVIELLSSLIYAMDGVTLIWCIKNGEIDYIKEIRKVFEATLVIASEYKLVE